jgi:hypothetical protein
LDVLVDADDVVLVAGVVEFFQDGDVLAVGVKGGSALLVATAMRTCGKRFFKSSKTRSSARRLTGFWRRRVWLCGGRGVMGIFYRKGV